MLANVLDFRTYSFPTLEDHEVPSPRELDQRHQWDYNGLSVVDREYFAYARGLALNLIMWLGCNFDITFPAGQDEHGEAISLEPIDDFELLVAGRYILNQACAILTYKKRADEEPLPGIRNCKFEDVERQLDLLLGNKDRWFGNWKLAKVHFEESTSLAFGDTTFTVKRKDLPLIFKGTLLFFIL